MGRVGWILALVVLWCTIWPGSAVAAPASRWLEVPHLTQLDGSPYQGSNCGPAAMGMVLAFYGQAASTRTLRAEVNDLQGTWGNYDSGTAVRSLVTIAARRGLRPIGAYDGAALRRWTLDEVRTQLDAGHPVLDDDDVLPGTPVATASSAFATRWRHSPCTGMTLRGRTML